MIVNKMATKQVSSIGLESKLNANIFSCMDATDYQRDFELSPGLLSK